MEKLRYEDSFVNEIIVNKINEIIDGMEKLEERLGDRMNAHWKYHRIKHEEEMAKKPQVIEKVREEISNGSAKEVPGNRTEEKPQDDK